MLSGVPEHGSLGAAHAGEPGDGGRADPGPATDPVEAATFGLAPAAIKPPRTSSVSLKTPAQLPAETTPAEQCQFRAAGAEMTNPNRRGICEIVSGLSRLRTPGSQLHPLLCSWRQEDRLPNALLTRWQRECRAGNLLGEAGQEARSGVKGLIAAGEMGDRCPRRHREPVPCQGKEPFVPIKSCPGNLRRTSGRDGLGLMHGLPRPLESAAHLLM